MCGGVNGVKGGGNTNRARARTPRQRTTNCINVRQATRQGINVNVERVKNAGVRETVRYGGVLQVNQYVMRWGVVGSKCACAGKAGVRQRTLAA